MAWTAEETVGTARSYLRGNASQQLEAIGGGDSRRSRSLSRSSASPSSAPTSTTSSSRPPTPSSSASSRSKEQNSLPLPSEEEKRVDEMADALAWLKDNQAGDLLEDPVLSLGSTSSSSRASASSRSTEPSKEEKPADEIPDAQVWRKLSLGSPVESFEGDSIDEEKRTGHQAGDASEDASALSNLDTIESRGAASSQEKRAVQMADALAWLKTNEAMAVDEDMSAISGFPSNRSNETDISTLTPQEEAKHIPPIDDALGLGESAAKNDDNDRSSLSETSQINERSIGSDSSSHLRAQEYAERFQPSVSSRSKLEPSSHRRGSHGPSIPRRRNSHSFHSDRPNRQNRNDIRDDFSRSLQSPLRSNSQSRLPPLRRTPRSLDNMREGSHHSRSSLSSGSKSWVNQSPRSRKMIPSTNMISRNSEGSVGDLSMSSRRSKVLSLYQKDRTSQGFRSSESGDNTRTRPSASNQSRSMRQRDMNVSKGSTRGSHSTRTRGPHRRALSDSWRSNSSSFSFHSSFQVVHQDNAKWNDLNATDRFESSFPPFPPFDDTEPVEPKDRFEASFSSSAPDLSSSKLIGTGKSKTRMAERGSFGEASSSKNSVSRYIDHSGMINVRSSKPSESNKFSSSKALGNDEKDNPRASVKKKDGFSVESFEAEVLDFVQSARKPNIGHHSSFPDKLAASSDCNSFGESKTAARQSEADERSGPSSFGSKNSLSSAADERSGPSSFGSKDSLSSREKEPEDAKEMIRDKDIRISQRGSVSGESRSSYTSEDSRKSNSLGDNAIPLACSSQHTNSDTSISFANVSAKASIHSRSQAKGEPPRSSFPSLDFLRAAGIVRRSTNSLEEVHVSVRNEGFCRNVEVAYEVLLEFRPRLKYLISVEEWIHLHVLLLYRRLFDCELAAAGVKQPEEFQIYVPPSIQILEPLAQVFASIGIVEDQDLGVRYVPVAKPVSKSGASYRPHDPEDVTEFLEWIQYDWHRSWKQVEESRATRKLLAEKDGIQIPEKSFPLSHAKLLEWETLALEKWLGWDDNLWYSYEQTTRMLSRQVSFVPFPTLPESGTYSWLLPTPMMEEIPDSNSQRSRSRSTSEQSLVCCFPKKSIRKEDWMMALLFEMGDLPSERTASWYCQTEPVGKSDRLELLVAYFRSGIQTKSGL